MSSGIFVEQVFPSSVCSRLRIHITLYIIYIASYVTFILYMYRLNVFHNLKHLSLKDLIVTFAVENYYSCQILRNVDPHAKHATCTE